MDNQKTISVFLGLITIFALIAVLKLASSVMMPIVFSILVTFTLSPIVDTLTKIKVPRNGAIILAVLIVFGIAYLVGLFFMSSINSFIEEAPKYYNRFESILTQISATLNQNFSMDLPVNPMAEIDYTATFMNSLTPITQNVMDFFSAIVIIVLSMIFLLIEAPFLPVTISKAFPRRTGKRIIIIIRHTTRQIGRYLSIKFFVSAITGVLVWFCLQVIGMDFALIWGVMAFILNFIPNIGSFILMAVTILMGFIQFFPQPGPIIFVFISMILIQVVVGNFFDPRLQGRRLNLSPVIILFSLFLWGWIWGPVGMFIAVPITTVLKIVFENIPGLKPIAVLMEYGKKVAKNRNTKKFKSAATILGDTLFTSEVINEVKNDSVSEQD